MYSPNFPFAREPFSRELAPSEVFVSEGYEELRVRLHHAIETGSLAVVTGQVGSGKSTALRAVMYSLETSRYRALYLANSQLTPPEFYRSLLHQLNVQPRRGFAENKRLLTQIMLEWHQKGVKPIVIIDEAQELGVPMLSELRFALNYQTDSFSPLTIILSGQPPLTETLRLQVLECIRQRITIHYRLPALNEKEVPAYILHHLRIAGMEKQIFTDDAMTMIYQYSKGLPRRINNICRYAIIVAITAESSVVDVDVVQKGMDAENL